MRKKKILIVSDYFYPHWTGIAKSMYYFVHAMSKYYELSILTVRHINDLKKEEDLFSAHILREDYLFAFSRVKYSLKIVLRFFLICKTFDVILVNSPCSNILPIVFLAKLFKKKVIILHHGDLILPEGFLNRCIEKVFDISSYFAFLFADQLLTFTTDYAEYSRVLKPFLRKCSTIIIPIDPFLRNARRNNEIKVSEKLKKLKKENKILFGFAGRFVEEKGFDRLINSATEVLRLIPNAHFVYAGETNISYEKFFPKIKKELFKLRDNITMLGLLQEPQLISFYKHIDFIIIPSRSDCFPIVQMEAMSLGVPSLVSDVPGARVLVKETGFGKIFSSMTPEDIANTLDLAVKEKKILLRNYTNVLSLLDSKTNVAKIRNIIEK